MPLGFLALLLLLLLPPVANGQCGFGFLPNVNGGLTSLSDLRISTPLTYVGTYTAIGCATDPGVISMQYTASVDGTYFFAPVQVITLDTQGTYFATNVFQSLIVTRLVPGEVIPAEVLVILTPLNGGIPVSGLNTFTMQVPATITLTPAAGVTGSVPTPTNAAGGSASPIDTSLGGNTFLQSTRPPSSTTTSIVTVTPSSGSAAAAERSSVPVGGIVGGVVGAAVALTALGAFAWYRSRIKRQSMFFGKGAPPEAPLPPQRSGQEVQLRTVQPSVERTLNRGDGYEGGDWMRYYPNLRQQNLYD